MLVLLVYMAIPVLQIEELNESDVIVLIGDQKTVMLQSELDIS